jgi:hypothetical protein
MDVLMRRRAHARRRTLWSALALAGLAATAGFAGWIGSALAEEPAGPSGAFAAANDAYRAGRYEDAARGYRALLQAGQDTGPVYFNLGNALVKHQRPAEAVWAYRNAAARLPRDRDVRANLERALSQAPGAEEASVRPPPSARWLTLGGRWTTRELAVAWVVCLWVACACRLLADWRVGGAATAVSRVALVAGLVGGVILVALVAQTVWVDRPSRAVVTALEATVRFAPQATGTLHFTLPAGAVVRVRQQLPGWIQVQRGDGRTGWIPEGTLIPLDRGA